MCVYLKIQIKLRIISVYLPLVVYEQHILMKPLITYKENKKIYINKNTEIQGKLKVYIIYCRKLKLTSL